jgi:hypothetical protein
MKRVGRTSLARRGGPILRMAVIVTTGLASIVNAFADARSRANAMGAPALGTVPRAAGDAVAPVSRPDRRVSGSDEPRRSGWRKMARSPLTGALVVGASVAGAAAVAGVAEAAMGTAAAYGAYRVLRFERKPGAAAKA